MSQEDSTESVIEAAPQDAAPEAVAADSPDSTDSSAKGEAATVAVDTAAVEEQIAKVNQQHNPQAGKGARERFGTAGKPSSENPSTATYLKPSASKSKKEGWTEVGPGLYAFSIANGKLLLRFAGEASTASTMIMLEGFWIKDGKLTESPQRG